MGIVIALAIFVVGGWFLWTKVIQPQMSVKYGELAIEAEKEYAEKGVEIREEAFGNPDKFGIFKKIIPEGEAIVAIASYLEPRSIGKNLLGEAKTMVTNVRKVNMCLFYFILTDKCLNAVAFNGENSVSHDMFDLDEIQEVKVEKAGSNYASGLKDALSGQESANCDKLKFTYKDKKYEYNMERVVTGFPIFEVKKDVMNENFYRIYNADKDNSQVNDYKTKEFYVDSKFRSELYREFMEAVGTRYGVNIPV